MNRSKLNNRKTAKSDYENLANRVKFKDVNRRIFLYSNDG